MNPDSISSLQSMLLTQASVIDMRLKARSRMQESVEKGTVNVQSYVSRYSGRISAAVRAYMIGDGIENPKTDGIVLDEDDVAVYIDAERPHAHSILRSNPEMELSNTTRRMVEKISGTSTKCGNSDHIIATTDLASRQVQAPIFQGEKREKRSLLGGDATGNAQLSTSPSHSRKIASIQESPSLQSDANIFTDTALNLVAPQSTHVLESEHFQLVTPTRNHSQEENLASPIERSENFSNERLRRLHDLLDSRSHLFQPSIVNVGSSPASHSISASIQDTSTNVTSSPCRTASLIPQLPDYPASDPRSDPMLQKVYLALHLNPEERARMAALQHSQAVRASTTQEPRPITKQHFLQVLEADTQEEPDIAQNSNSAVAMTREDDSHAISGSPNAPSVDIIMAAAKQMARVGADLRAESTQHTTASQQDSSTIFNVVPSEAEILRSRLFRKKQRRGSMTRDFPSAATPVSSRRHLSLDSSSRLSQSPYAMHTPGISAHSGSIGALLGDPKSPSASMRSRIQSRLLRQLRTGQPDWEDTYRDGVRREIQVESHSRFAASLRQHAPEHLLNTQEEFVKPNTQNIPPLQALHVLYSSGYFGSSPKRPVQQGSKARSDVDIVSQESEPFETHSSSLGITSNGSSNDLAEIQTRATITNLVRPPNSLEQQQRSLNTFSLSDISSSSANTNLAISSSSTSISAAVHLASPTAPVSAVHETLQGPLSHVDNPHTFTSSKEYQQEETTTRPSALAPDTTSAAPSQPAPSDLLLRQFPPEVNRILVASPEVHRELQSLTPASDVRQISAKIAKLIFEADPNLARSLFSEPKKQEQGQEQSNAQQNPQDHSRSLPTLQAEPPSKVPVHKARLSTSAPMNAGAVDVPPLESENTPLPAHLHRPVTHRVVIAGAEIALDEDYMRTMEQERQLMNEVLALDTKIPIVHQRSKSNTGTLAPIPHEEPIPIMVSAEAQTENEEEIVQAMVDMEKEREGASSVATESVVNKASTPKKQLTTSATCATCAGSIPTSPASLPSIPDREIASPGKVDTTTAAADISPSLLMQSPKPRPKAPAPLPLFPASSFTHTLIKDVTVASTNTAATVAATSETASPGTNTGMIHRIVQSSNLDALAQRSISLSPSKTRHSRFSPSPVRSVTFSPETTVLSQSGSVAGRIHTALPRGLDLFSTIQAENNPANYGTNVKTSPSRFMSRTASPKMSQKPRTRSSSIPERFLRNAERRYRAWKEVFGGSLEEQDFEQNSVSQRDGEYVKGPDGITSAAAVTSVPLGPPPSLFRRNPVIQTRVVTHRAVRAAPLSSPVVVPSDRTHVVTTATSTSYSTPSSSPARTVDVPATSPWRELYPDAFAPPSSTMASPKPSATVIATTISPPSSNTVLRQILYTTPVDPDILPVPALESNEVSAPGLRATKKGPKAATESVTDRAPQPTPSTGIVLLPVIDEQGKGDGESRELPVGDAGVVDRDIDGQRCKAAERDLESPTDVDDEANNSEERMVQMIGEDDEVNLSVEKVEESDVVDAPDYEVAQTIETGSSAVLTDDELLRADGAEGIVGQLAEKEEQTHEQVINLQDEDEGSNKSSDIDAPISLSLDAITAQDESPRSTVSSDISDSSFNEPDSDSLEPIPSSRYPPLPASAASSLESSLSSLASTATHSLAADMRALYSTMISFSDSIVPPPLPPVDEPESYKIEKSVFEGMGDTNQPENVERVPGNESLEKLSIGQESTGNATEGVLVLPNAIDALINRDSTDISPQQPSASQSAASHDSIPTDPSRSAHESSISSFDHPIPHPTRKNLSAREFCAKLGVDADSLPTKTNASIRDQLRLARHTPVSDAQSAYARNVELQKTQAIGSLNKSHHESANGDYEEVEGVPRDTIRMPMSDPRELVFEKLSMALKDESIREGMDQLLGKLGMSVDMVFAAANRESNEK